MVSKFSDCDRVGLWWCRNFPTSWVLSASSVVTGDAFFGFCQDCPFGSSVVSEFLDFFGAAGVSCGGQDWCGERGGQDR